MSQDKPLPMTWQVSIVVVVVLCMARHIAML